ncbi:MAG: hypothetical protein JWL77_311 [Chthonomonadaceae bacterium]|nr:hypothetical protein [Chthonomonadaceae bacterium]
MSPENAGNRGGSQERPHVPHTPFSLRVTFSYDRREPNGNVRLARVERVRAVAPGIATAPPQPGQSGAWFEARDAAGALLYYRPLHDPMPATREAFADEAGQPHLSRLPNEAMQGEFTLLVPDLPNAVSFTFHSTPPADAAGTSLEGTEGAEADPRRLMQPAQEMVRMTFDELRRKANERV